MILSLLSGENLAQAAEAIGETATKAAAAVQQTSGGAAAAPRAGGMGPMFWVFYIICLVALFYFFAIRPNKKREQERQNLRDQIKLGDWVVTTGGLYGKVVNVYAEEFMLEFGTNKSVTIPVRKEEVIGVKEPGLANEPTPVEVEDKPKKKNGLFK